MSSSNQSDRLANLLATKAIFHEVQSLQLCAVHSLNNLFCNEPRSSSGDGGNNAVSSSFGSVEPIFTKASLDAIAERKHDEQRATGTYAPPSLLRDGWAAARSSPCGSVLLMRSMMPMHAQSSR